MALHGTPPIPAPVRVINLVFLSLCLLLRPHPTDHLKGGKNIKHLVSRIAGIGTCETGLRRCLLMAMLAGWLVH